MRHAILFCNGDINDITFHENQIKKDDFIIAVDGGGKHCQKLGVLPNLALGDFDTLPLELQSFYREKSVEILKYPSDKDYIDLALGIEVALDRGYRELIILGALGGKRIDMEVGNLLLLSKYDADIKILDENREILCLFQGKSFVAKDKVGQYLSVIPLCDKTITGKSRGLKYQLNELIFSLGETRGISNEILENNADFSLLKGKALIVCQKR